MGIRFTCPNGHKLHVKAFLAGKRGVCPHCGVKILIPSQEQVQQQAPLNSAELQRVGAIDSSVTPAGSFTDAGSASIVLAVADSSIANSPIAVIAPVASQIPNVHPPSFVLEDVEPESPADHYIAKRARSRRNQSIFAVMLLVAVIVLAGLLIFVLQRSAGSASAKNSPPVRVNESLSSGHVAVLSRHHFNAHRALVANS